MSASEEESRIDYKKPSYAQAHGARRECDWHLLRFILLAFQVRLLILQSWRGADIEGTFSHVEVYSQPIRRDMFFMRARILSPEDKPLYSSTCLPILFLEPSVLFFQRPI